MHVLLKGKIYNSDEIPVLILFTPAELTQFKGEPSNIDMHCSYPPWWGNEKGRAWLQGNKDKLVRARNKNVQKVGRTFVPNDQSSIASHKIRVPESSSLTVGISPTKMSDKGVVDLFRSLDSDSIETFGEEQND